VLSARDRVFLKDFADLAAKSHLYSALALETVMVSPHALVGGLQASAAVHEGELVSEAQRTTEAARFQVICQAKIFSEMVAAYEDFGALCSSVAHRGQRDIMVGYLQSSVGEVERFYRKVLQSEHVGLDLLLKLPSLQSVLNVASVDVGQVFERSYVALPQIIHAAARHYSTIPDVAYDTCLGDLEDKWQERIHIFHDVGPAGASPRRVPHRRIYEKIKHRFAVLARLPDYAALGSDHDIHGVAYPRTQDFLRDMIDHLDMMTCWTRDLPYMLLNLDACGVLQ